MNNQKKLLEDRRYADVVFFAVFAVVTCFLFWKCRYGFGNVDESFYLTIPYRLLQGDGLFQEEWHLSQMASVLTLPIVALYVLISGGTEGILLMMRYVCTAVQCVLAVFFYFRMKKISWLGASIATISFLLYIPFGIMALSYNSMGIMFLLLSLVIILTAQQKKKLQYVFAGLAFAASVLCCPYLLLVYLLYVFAALIRTIRHRKADKKIETMEFCSVQGAMYVTGGAAVAAIVFAVFVLLQSSLSGIIQAFPQMMNDPEHMPSPPFYKTYLFFTSIIQANRWSGYIYGCFALLAVACILDKKRKVRRGIYTSAAAICTLILMYSLWQINNYINHLMWSVNMLALFLLFLTDNKQIWNIFYSIWIPGILYSYCLNATSNQTFNAIASASSVATFGSIIIIVLCGKELLNTNFPYAKLATGLLGVILAFQLISQTVERYQAVFWENGMQNLTIEIDEGIEKGLVVSESYRNTYYQGLEVLEEVEKYEPNKVLYLSENTWYYLQGKAENAAYSAWLSGINDYNTLERLWAYYLINPHKYPDVVFVEKIYEDVAIKFCELFCYQINTVDQGYILLPA